MWRIMQWEKIVFSLDVARHTLLRGIWMGTVDGFDLRPDPSTALGVTTELCGAFPVSSIPVPVDSIGVRLPKSGREVCVDVWPGEDRLGASCGN
jgi:hypothetical protein